MGNILYKEFDYENNIITCVNSFAPTNKKYNYVIQRLDDDDDEDNKERSNTTERFKIKKLKKKKKKSNVLA